MQNVQGDLVGLRTVHWNLEDFSLTEQVNLWHFITIDIGSKAETCVLLLQSSWWLWHATITS